MAFAIGFGEKPIVGLSRTRVIPYSHTFTLCSSLEDSLSRKESEMLAALERLNAVKKRQKVRE